MAHIAYVVFRGLRNIIHSFGVFAAAGISSKAEAAAAASVVSDG